SDRGRVEESLQLRVSEFASRAITNLGVEQLAEIATRLRAIKQHLDEIDLADLALVPERSLTQIAEKLARLNEWFDEYIAPAVAAERARKPEMNRSDMHKLTDQNISK